MKILLVTFGSRGDVHPMLALGCALQRRGHQAVLLSNPAFRDEAVNAGLDFVPVGQAQDYQQTLAHPKLWHPVDGLGVLWRYLLRPALRPTYEALRGLAASADAADAAHGRELLVVANPMAMGARVAQEKLGLRLVSAYTAATMLRSVQDPLTIAQQRIPASMPHSARRSLWALLDSSKLDPLVKPALEALRAELGLAPLDVPVFGGWTDSPLGGLTLFPPWFAPTPSDWPAQVWRGEFPLYDEDQPCGVGAPSALDAGLAAFLDAGPAPVVFMPGSAQQGAQDFFQSAIEACQRLGLRGVLLGHLGDLAGKPLPQGCWAGAYQPFGALLPRARAIVHHGGIGTCAQALRAGLPQLVWPQAYDQFDNAMRLEQLGVGLSLGAGPVTAEALAGRLAPLLGSEAIGAACQHRAAQMSAGTGLDASCEWLEQLQ